MFRFFEDTDYSKQSRRKTNFCGISRDEAAHENDVPSGLKPPSHGRWSAKHPN